MRYKSSYFGHSEWIISNFAFLWHPTFQLAIFIPFLQLVFLRSMPTFLLTPPLPYYLQAVSKISSVRFAVVVLYVKPCKKRCVTIFLLSKCRWVNHYHIILNAFTVHNTTQPPVIWSVFSVLLDGNLQSFLHFFVLTDWPLPWAHLLCASGLSYSTFKDV